MEPQSPELVEDDQYQVHDGSIISITSKGPLLDLDDLATTNPLFSTNINFPPNIYHVATDYSNVQSTAVQELIKLANDGCGTFWKTINGREVLREFDYNQNFPKPNRNSKTRFEASRALDEVTMDHKELANMLINNYCLNELFPTIVSNAKLIHDLSPGKSVNNPDGSVQLMPHLIHLKRLIIQQNIDASLLDV
ncbi:Homeobox domain [Artemisia annua]|uniref:Homeobox domain n=1 Tax=Artemisia annua TaxID=35608 RepID=A0A2U1LT14_ARTAN|nr:Homeobox domain [Artemisia annua]